MQSRPIRLVYDATNDVWIVPPPQQPVRAKPSKLDAVIDGVGTLLAMAALCATAYVFLLL